jgi:hypothetical protein
MDEGRFLMLGFGLSVSMGSPSNSGYSLLPFFGALQIFPLRFDQLIFPIRAHQQSE